jgi:hypothetical protein
MATIIMANPWFRMYSEFATDPKVQMMSENYQRRLTMLLCFRCNEHVTLQDSEVTFLLRISDDEWATTKECFIAKGFINNDNEILNWDKRQFQSDTSKNRVAAYRERKKKECNVTVTLPVTKSNGVEQIQNRTEHINTPLAMLVSMGINESLAKDWISVRNKKKLATTQTALDKIKSHAEKHNYTFEQAVKLACENGWAGFNVKWLDELEPKSQERKLVL